MKIQLKDQTPAQKTYYSMPKPLHLEVKHYIEDLLNKGWITKSTSHYSSPIAAVQKEDESLRLCCDYWSLNSKTQVDPHPLPRIQDVIDTLKGKKYFSVLDQQKLITKFILMLKTTFWLPLLPHGAYMNGLGFHLDWQMHQLSSRDLWKAHCLICEINLLFHTLMTTLYFLIHLMTTWTI